jgi:predicted CopG family antitoxin
VEGTVYYRLKQVDKDGKVSYSKVIKLFANKDIGFVSVYPNPATVNDIKVHIEVADSQKVYIRIIDIAGKVVYSNLNTSLNAGKNDCVITNKTKLLKGVYTVEVQSSEKKEVIGRGRFVVQ